MNTTDLQFCIVIPNFNHTHAIEAVLKRVAEFNLPIVMIDDGSNDQAKALFAQLAQQFSLLRVLTHQHNQGKGGAVQTGLRWAAEHGYSHAIQVDADGQHTLADIKKLIALAQLHPNDLISGRPVYDDSVPKHRYWARYITHVWVWIETLSLALKDSMCGFRVYPVAASIKVMNQYNIGKRMDFDTEIMVRLYWQGLDVRFLKTHVVYPQNGVSHFQPLRDNIKISWLHTRLFFGMLVRIPQLLARKVK